MTDHFIPLVKAIKNSPSLTLCTVMDWYGEQYLMVVDQSNPPLHILKSISIILLDYCKDKGVLKPVDFIERLAPDNLFSNRFTDVNYSHHEHKAVKLYYTNIISECCAILRMTEVSKYWTPEEWNNEN